MSKAPGSKVVVSEKVLEGIKAVRDTGATNMFDVNAVLFIANELELYETVIWIHDNRAKYLRGILAGFKVEEEA